MIQIVAWLLQVVVTALVLNLQDAFDNWVAFDAKLAQVRGDLPYDLQLGFQVVELILALHGLLLLR